MKKKCAVCGKRATTKLISKGGKYDLCPEHFTAITNNPRLLP